jgi:hypothetical protein
MASVTESGALQKQVRAMALAAGDRRTLFAYQAFDYVNAHYFGHELPDPLFLWGITEWSGCLGYTQPREVQVIMLHPTLLSCQGKDVEGKPVTRAWGFPVEDLGPAFAFETIVHECIHLAINHRYGGWGGCGESSHNNDHWISEVNRIAPLLGLQLTAGRNTPKRVPVEGPLTKRGKQPTKVQRVNEGDVPFSAVAAFPQGVRYHLVAPEWWRAKTQGKGSLAPDPSTPPFYRSDLPFAHALQSRACNVVQCVTNEAAAEQARTCRVSRALEALREADAMSIMDMITALDGVVQDELWEYMDSSYGPASAIEALESALLWAESADEDGVLVQDPVDDVVRLGDAVDQLHNLHRRVCSRTPTIPVTAGGA